MKSNKNFSEITYNHMIKLLTITTLLFSCIIKNKNNMQPSTTTTTDTSIYDFKVPALDGSTIDFASFKGKNINSKHCFPVWIYQSIQNLGRIIQSTPRQTGYCRVSYQ